MLSIVAFIIGFNLTIFLSVSIQFHFFKQFPCLMDFLTEEICCHFWTFTACVVSITIWFVQAFLKVTSKTFLLLFEICFLYQSIEPTITLG